MATILRQKIKLAFEERDVGGPAFVFVHGWSCDRSFFAPQVEHFSRQHRVVAVDLRGHGESDKPQGVYRISDYADDTASIVDQLGFGKVVAVGHSSGAWTVMQLAALHPELVAAIVMVDPAPFVMTPERRASAEAMVAAMEQGDQEPRRRYIMDRMFLPTSDRRLVTSILNAMLATPSHAAAYAMRGALEFDAPAIAAQCKVQALHLAATQSGDPSPRNPPHLMSGWLPNVVNGWTVGAGHFSQLEVPEQVNAMIEAFLRHYV